MLTAIREFGVLNTHSLRGGKPYLIDYQLLEIHAHRIGANTINGVEYTGLGNLASGVKVEKAGRTTGTTTGTLNGVCLCLKGPHCFKRTTFALHTVVGGRTPFNLAGDSGALGRVGDGLTAMIFAEGVCTERSLYLGVVHDLSWLLGRIKDQFGLDLVPFVAPRSA
jgi:hypothetical protein